MRKIKTQREELSKVLNKEIMELEWKPLPSGLVLAVSQSCSLEKPTRKPHFSFYTSPQEAGLTMTERGLLMHTHSSFLLPRVR
jgi:hypothetical protein